MTRGVSSKMLEEVWKTIIREKEESGLTIDEYCRKNKLTPSAYYYWSGKLKRGKQGTTQRLMELRESKHSPANPVSEVTTQIVIHIGDLEIMINNATDDLIFKMLAEARKAS